MNTFNEFLLGVALILVVMNGVSFLLGGAGRDDTDAPNGSRSGLRLYTDHRTGCQYVSHSPFAGLTLRLDKDGKPVCVATTKE